MWVRIRGEVKDGDVTMGLGYRQHRRAKEVEKAPHNNFFKQLKEVSRLHTLFVCVFSRDLCFCDTCREQNGTAQATQTISAGCQGLLLDMGTGWAKQCHTQLELLFINKEEMAVDVILSGRLGCSDCEIVRPKTLWGTEKDKYQNTHRGLQEN